MGAITEIFRAFAPDYVVSHPNMPNNHKKVITAIINCRAGAYGLSYYHCEKCGKKHRIYRSCGNRHCPQCQYHKSRQWLEAQQERALPTNHFMLTFTVPETLRSFIRQHQLLAYAALFSASSESMKSLAGDKRFIGTDLPGFTGVLHTWGRQLQYHPHIHYIVPGGGLDAQRETWLPSGKAFYLPVKALSPIFRAKFRDAMAKAELLDLIDPSVWEVNWVVNCQAIGSSEGALKYLAPYIFRVAISDSRIKKIEGDQVTFAWKKPGSCRERKSTLNVMEFMRRYLQHVLPSGFMKVRHFGFMNFSCSMKGDKLRAMIMVQMTKKLPTLMNNFVHKKTAVKRVPLCGDCGGVLHFLFSIIRGKCYPVPT